MAEASTQVINRIKSYYRNMSDKEKRIADYILKDPNKIIHTTINQVSEDLGVADATVFRFCKTLGYKGYQALKIALASEIVSPIQDIHEKITEEDSEMDILQKVFQANVNAIQYTKDIQQEATFTKALEYIMNSRQIHFYGNGGSGITALDAQHKFMRSGLSSHAYTDTHIQLMAASQLTSQDVALFISHTGSNKDILEVIEVAKENNVPTIGITNFAKSPFSKLVDACLFTTSQETDYRSEALASRIAELSIIDALYVNYSLKYQEQAQHAQTKMRDAIARRRL